MDDRTRKVVQSFLLEIANQGGVSWQDVDVPDAAFSFVPFTVQQNGRSFRPDPAFSLATQSGITVAKTYYVKTDGSDAASGLDWANALATVGVAAAKADVDRIYVAKGYYFRNLSGSGVTPGRSVQIIGDLIVGTGDAVYLTADCRNQMGAFSLVDSHYVATTTRTVRHVWDASAPDSYGEDVMLTPKTSIAEVDATPGSWWQNGTSVYIRTLDSRAPDTNIRYYEQSAPCAMTADSRTLYVENINYRGGWNTCLIKNASATGGTKFYAKNCTFKYANRPANSYDCVDIEGVDESILWGCTISKAVEGDGINYKVLNGKVPLAMEIDCEAYDCGDAGTDQGSTMHDGGSIVRIGGEYHHTRGQCIADAGGGQMWNLGVYMHDSASTGANKDGYNITQTGTTAWLDSCTISVARYDLVGAADGTIYYRNLVSGGNFEPSGVYTAY